MFSVGPAGPSSFDAALARTGIPMFAVDLRTTPTSGVAEFNTPQSMREIGAIYDEKKPDIYFQPAYPHNYDVVFLRKQNYISA